MRHPVKLVVRDDLQRSRATVAFRLLLAIPHLVWLVLWGVAAYVAALCNWLSALVTGTPWHASHAFAARYLRYATHVHAYVLLLADPYPGFLGEDDYPVRVELPEPAPQNRWTTLFRLPLALPALLIAGLLTSGWYQGDGWESNTTQGGLLATVAVLGWFASIALARMPRGLRDAGAYALSYAAQLHAYLLVLTDRYPDSDPLAALDDLPPDEHPIRLAVSDDLRRNRLTVLFRLLLAIPHFIWVFVWGIGAFFATIANWFATLFTGRSPQGLHDFLADYLRYTTYVYAYVELAADPYPGFDGDDPAYPVQLHVDDPRPQDRLTVAFRIVLAVPAIAVVSAYVTVAAAASVLGWFVSLVRGEMPRGLRNLIALSLRANQQLTGYLFVLTDRYPYSGPTVAAVEAEPEEPPRFLPPDAYAAV